MEVVENKQIDTKAIENLEKTFEKAEKDFSKKKYMLELNDDLVKFYTETFLTGITWKGYECYAVTELNKEFTKVFGKKTTALWSREHIEATFHFIKTFEGKGDITLAATMKDFCDAFAKPMQDIQQDIQNLKDLATELEAARQGITVEEMLTGKTEGPK